MGGCSANHVLKPQCSNIIPLLVLLREPYETTVLIIIMHYRSVLQRKRFEIGHSIVWLDLLKQVQQRWARLILGWVTAKC